MDLYPNKKQFNQAEIKRKMLIKSEKLGPKFTNKLHPKAVYTSRPLSFFISKCSSIDSFSEGKKNFNKIKILPLDTRYCALNFLLYIDLYTSLALELDIDIKRYLIKKF